MKKHRILIIGASGLVGGNCLKYFAAKEDVEVAGTYYSFAAAGLWYYDTLNPANPANFDIDSFKPTHILHAGALTHVDYCETHPDESYLKTVTSTQNMAKLAARYHAQVIYISTDYVFDGYSGPYDENAATNPLSVYGRHKLEAENIVRDLHDNHIIIRVTNVYGDEIRNKNFVSRLIEAGRLGEKLELNLPGDQYATPLNAFDLARGLYCLITDHKTGLYHFASTDYLNRVQLAEKVLSRFPKLQVHILSHSTQSLRQAAERPLQGGLKAVKFLSEYPYFYFSSVDEYLINSIF